MLVTLWGILIDVRQLQSANAPDLMFVTFGGILIDVRLLQLRYLYISVYQSLLGKTVEK